MGGGCLIGLNYEAMYKVAGTLEIDVTACLLQKIQILEHHQLGRQFKKEKPEQQQP